MSLGNIIDRGLKRPCAIPLEKRDLEMFGTKHPIPSVDHIPKRIEPDTRLRWVRRLKDVAVLD